MCFHELAAAPSLHLTNRTVSGKMEDPLQLHESALGYLLVTWGEVRTIHSGMVKCRGRVFVGAIKPSLRIALPCNMALARRIPPGGAPRDGIATRLGSHGGISGKAVVSKGDGLSW